MIIAASCCCGPNEKGDRCRGGSNITDADGRLLAELWDEEGVILADVDPPQALALRAGNPTWQRITAEKVWAGSSCRRSKSKRG